MVQQVQLITEREDASFAGFPHAIRAGLLTALMSNNAFAYQDDFDALRYVSAHWNFKAGGAGQSYQNLRTVQMSPEKQLATALRSLYDTLAAEQQELEADAKDVLYANLWSLYA